MFWENWLVAISIGVIAIAFVVLIVFLILALLSMKKMVNDLDQKVRAFDPLFRILTKAGHVIERTAEKQLHDVEETFREKEEYTKKRSTVNTALEVAEWALVGLALWHKFKEKRR